MHDLSTACGIRWRTVCTGGTRRAAIFPAAVVALLVALSGNLQAQVLYSGSDTVQPVAAAALVAFGRGHPAYKPQIKDIGTGGGLRELCGGRAIIAGASRPIKPDEIKACSAAGIQPLEIPVALDAVVLAVSTKNNWLKDLTFAEAAKIFDATSVGKITSWKQIRSSFPDTPIHPAGVGIKHSTFGFFSESMGLNGFIRSDYKDFNTHAAAGVYTSADANAIAFMPVGEAKALESQLRIVAIDFGSGAVLPGIDEVAAGKYDKLARTVYLYINPAVLAKSTADDIDFTNLLVKDMDKFVRFANLVPLRALQYQENVKRLAQAK